MKHSIAVLLTYYNEGDLLTACLQSLLDGSDLPEEILIYDDGSTLPPEAFIPPGAPVRVIRGSENRGPGFGRNVLMRESQADYIHCHDADDEFHRDWCAKVRAALAASDADIVLSEMGVLDAQRRRIGDSAMLKHLRDGDDLTLFALLKCISTPQSTFARRLGLEVGGFRTREVLASAEDCDFHVRLSQAAARFAVIHEALYTIWLRPASLSRQDSRSKAESLVCGIRSSELLADELPERYRPLLAERALRRAVKLNSLGFRDEARAGYAVARRLAPAKSARLDRRYPMQALVGLVGFETAAGVIGALGPVRWRLRLRRILKR